MDDPNDRAPRDRQSSSRHREMPDEQSNAADRVQVTAGRSVARDFMHISILTYGCRGGQGHRLHNVGECDTRGFTWEWLESNDELHTPTCKMQRRSGENLSQGLLFYYFPMWMDDLALPILGEPTECGFCDLLYEIGRRMFQRTQVLFEAEDEEAQVWHVKLHYILGHAIIVSHPRNIFSPSRSCVVYHASGKDLTAT